MASIASRPIPTSDGPTRRWANLATAAAAFSMTLLVVLGWSGGLATAISRDGPLTGDETMFMHDFLTHYAEGKLVLAGGFGQLYDPALQQQAQYAVAGPDYGYTSVYLLPPIASIIFAPFAMLPYLPAAILWAVCSIALIAASVRTIWEISPLRGRESAFLPAVAIAGSFPFAMNLLTGNNAALWLAIYAFGLRALFGGREVVAGIILGLGALKPQLFLAVPVLLLAQRRWRTFGAWAATSATLAVASFLMVGIDGAKQYVSFLASDRYESAVAVANTWRMPSLPALIRSIEPEGGNLVVYAVILGALILLAWCIRRASLPLAASAAVIVGVLVDPHVFAYDALVLVVPILIWAVTRPGGAPRGVLPAFWLLGWAMLFVTYPPPGSLAAIPWAVLPLTVLGAAALHRARHTPVPEPAPGFALGAGSAA